MKSDFYLILKAFFILKIFKFFSWPFGHVEKWLDQKGKVNLKLYNVTTWETNNYNIHIFQYLNTHNVQYLRSNCYPKMKLSQVS